MASGDGLECVPAEGTVELTCDVGEMTVSFYTGHLYVNMDELYLDSESSSVSVEGCGTVTSIEGRYTIHLPLDSCGTIVSHEDGIVKFTNTIKGNVDATMVNDVLTTDLLRLDLYCEYPDVITLTGWNLFGDGDIFMDGASAIGKVSTIFTIAKKHLYI